MENIDTKQKILGIVYILSFVTLFTGMFAVLSNLLYTQTNTIFYVFFLTFNCIALAFCVAITGIVIYNFFAKKQLIILEIILYVCAIVAFIVMFIYANFTYIPNADAYASVYSSYLGIMMQLLASVVLLFGAKIAMLCLKRKQIKTASEVENAN